MKLIAYFSLPWKPVLLCALYIPSLAVGQNDADQATLGSGEEWNINCIESVQTAKRWIQDRDKSTKEKLDKPEFATLQQQLDVCGNLFNNPDNQAYRPCPDYVFFAGLLAKLNNNSDESWWQKQTASTEFALQCLN